MSISDSSVILAVLAGGLGAGGLGGYLTRRLQKLEERIDNTNLKVLPSIYYNTYYFIESAEIFRDNGLLVQFTEKVKEINKSLKCLISSGDIIPSDDQIKELFKTILEFHTKIEGLEDFLIRNTHVESSSEDPANSEEKERKANNIGDLRRSLDEGAEKFSLPVDLQSCSIDAKRLNERIENKLKGYKSISWFLVLLTVGLASVIVAIQILTADTSNSVPNEVLVNQSSAHGSLHLLINLLTGRW